MTNIDARYPSTERVVRDDVLVYAEGDEIPETDPAELRRQGYLTDDEEPTPTAAAASFPSKERVVRDGVLVYSEGDPIPASDVEELERQGYPTDDGKSERPGRDKKRRSGADK